MADKQENNSTAFDNLTVIDLQHAAAEVQEDYKNFVLTRINDHCVRMSVMQGEYPWHSHPRSDECFLILEGCLEIDLLNASTITLLRGHAFNVPAGVVHRTRAKTRTVSLCFEHLSAYADAEFTSASKLPR